MIINRILFETSYIGNPQVFFSVCFGVLWLFIIIPFFFIMRNWKKYLGNQENKNALCIIKYIFSILMPIFIMIVLVIYLISLGREYTHTVLKYKRGNYCEVEGVTEEYIKKSHSEKFIINDVKFENNSNPTWGYSTLPGRAITGDGQRLRIRYVPLGRRNVIVYIEEIP